MIKEKLKQRLLEIPINYKAYRERIRLANDLNVDVEDIESYLKELVELKIIKEKKQYFCPTCSDTEIMDNETLEEYLEDDYFQCDTCGEYISPKRHKTGHIYYDIKDKDRLKNW